MLRQSVWYIHRFLYPVNRWEGWRASRRWVIHKQRSGLGQMHTQKENTQMFLRSVGCFQFRYFSTVVGMHVAALYINQNNAWKVSRPVLQWRIMQVTAQVRHSSRSSFITEMVDRCWTSPAILHYHQLPLVQLQFFYTWGSNGKY